MCLVRPSEVYSRRPQPGLKDWTQQLQPLTFTVLGAHGQLVSGNFSSWQQSLIPQGPQDQMQHQGYYSVVIGASWLALDASACCEGLVTPLPGFQLSLLNIAAWLIDELCSEARAP